MLTANDLRLIMPNCQRPELWAGLLGPCMEAEEIDTVTRAAAFLATLAHESGEFRYMEELASGDAYEKRQDLGNYKKGDGRRYKGRGAIQLTGRDNYREAGKAIGMDLELYYEEAAKPSVAAPVAAWFWRKSGCNELADKLDFDGLTRRINGGYRHLAQRKQFYYRALEVLGRGEKLGE